MRIKHLIEHICLEEKKDGHWVKNLQAEGGLKRGDVEVRILMLSPTSPIIQTIEILQQVTPNSLKNEVLANHEKLEKFAIGHNIRLAPGSSICIRATNGIRNFNITYTKSASQEPPDELLMIFSFLRNDKPVYQILDVENIGTYNDCINYFDALWRKACQSPEYAVFLWNDTGISYEKIPLKNDTVEDLPTPSPLILPSHLEDGT